ncbi:MULTISPECIES: DNA-processing protein DprA [Burkholderiaceae]|uniref:DNA-processing protein DprA n=1 Tax=Burkholderiaceae TaxID=119060 RepID=UPI00095D5E12|nr:MULTISPECIES: DNA-processing protein DprA [Burkholderiaceae]SIT70659.1 DNA processing protein [Burkholderia sp. b13]
MNTTIQPPMLAADELAAWLTLAHTPRVPASAALALLAAFGSPRPIMTETAAGLERVVGAVAAQALLQSRDAVAPRVEAALAWTAGDARLIVPFGHPAYPPALLTLYDPPPLLYVHGTIGALHRPALAIVGSRNPTPQGNDNARLFAQALAAQGVCIVSGLALGIDGAAHRGALDSGGVTVAITGSGADVIYPQRHVSLAAEIVERGGAILSEWPLGAAPLRQHFPQRNRLIAAMVRGVLVVEAAPYSGSLITARLANDIGRDIFAIPGSIHSPMSRGCHRLIKDGAKLVETPHDVLTELRLPEPGVEAAPGTAPASVQAAPPTVYATHALAAHTPELSAIHRPEAAISASDALATRMPEALTAHRPDAFTTDTAGASTTCPAERATIRPVRAETSQLADAPAADWGDATAAIPADPLVTDHHARPRRYRTVTPGGARRGTAAVRAPTRHRAIGPWSSARRRPAYLAAARNTQASHPADAARRAALGAIGHDPVTLETLVQRTHLDCATLQAVLLELELAGTIVALPGGRFQRA